jgi:hypothetical protein
MNQLSQFALAIVATRRRQSFKAGGFGIAVYYFSVNQGRSVKVEAN